MQTAMHKEMYVGSSLTVIRQLRKPWRLYNRYRLPDRTDSMLTKSVE
jgi:hypothetical protein